MRTSLLAALALPLPAAAAWPADVVLSGMGEHRGRPVEQQVIEDGYRDVIQGLGVAIANKPLAPARTLGSAGFDVSFGLTATVLDPSPTSDGDPTGWALATERTGAALAIPTLTVRKGLPGSVELGASAGWVAGSRQGVLGGFARFAPVEGYEPWPDISFQAGYAGYVGNSELLLGTLDLTASIGASVPFGETDEVRQARFSPWIGGGLLVVHGRALIDPDAQATLFGPDRTGDPTRTPLTPLPQVQVGLQITNNTALVRLSTAWTPGVAPSIHAGMGFMF